MPEANADPLHPTGAPAPDGRPSPYAGLEFYKEPPPPAPVYRAVIEREMPKLTVRHKAEAPTAQEACDLAWKLKGGPHTAACLAEIKDRDARIAELETERDELRQTIKELMRALGYGREACSACGATWGAKHDAGCVVLKAQRLLERA